MFCPKCGKEIKDNTKFCKYCGVSINQNRYNSSQIKNISSNRNKNIMIIVLVIIICIVAMSCILMVTGVFNHNSSSTNSNTQLSTQPSKSISLNAFPISEAPNLAYTVQSSGYGSSVNFGGVTFTKAQYLYVLSKSIVEISSGNANGTISVGSYNYCSNPSGTDASQTITSSQYIDMCTRFSNWISNQGTVPNYNGINQAGVPDVSPTNMAKICCDILIQYKSTGKLPATLNI